MKKLNIIIVSYIKNILKNKNSKKRHYSSDIWLSWWITGLGFYFLHPKLERYFKNISNLKFIKSPSQSANSKGSVGGHGIMMTEKTRATQNSSIFSNIQLDTKTDTEEQNFGKLNQSF